MLVSEISIWGAALVALFVLIAAIALAFIDKKMLRPVGTAILVGSVVVGGSTILCLPISVFMTVYSVLMACLTASMIQTMGNYQRSLHNPETCNLSWSERMLPNIRSMGQPLVVVIPTLFAGMLLGGVSVLASLIVVILLVAAAFVANVLSGVVALAMLSRGDAVE